MRFYAAPEYQVFPTRERPLKPYEAVVRAVGETAPARARLPPGRGRQRHPHAGARAGRRAGGRAAGRRSCRTSIRPPPPGVPPYGLGAMPPRGAARASVLARARAADAARRRARAPGAERDAPPRRPAGARAALRRDQPRPVHRRHLPAARVPAPWPAGVHVTGPADLGAARRRVGAAGRGRAARAGRAEHLAGPRPDPAAGGARGLARAAGAGARGTPPRRARPCRTRRNARLVEWVTY